MFFLPFLTKTIVSSDPYIHARVRALVSACRIHIRASIFLSLSLCRRKSVEERVSHLATRVSAAGGFFSGKQARVGKTRGYLSLSLFLCDVRDPRGLRGTLRPLWLVARIAYSQVTGNDVIPRCRFPFPSRRFREITESLAGER